MKLRVPTLLLSALLAAMTVTQAHANYVVNSGTFYDTGKEYASTMPKPGTTGTPENESHHDDYYCWALAASNVTQYWQDTYKDKVQHADSLPNGITSVKEDVSPYGTSYLDIYEKFLANTPNTVEADTGAFQRQFIQWYFKGDQITIGDTTITTGGGNYYGDAYTNIPYAYSYQENGDGLDWYTFQTKIKEAFDKAGTVVGLDVQRHNPGGVQNKQHAMTCWGYEMDADDNITSLIMSDSDDRYFGTFRLDVKNVGGKVAVLTDNHIVKENNDNEVYFLGRDYQEAKNFVYALTTIVTPEDSKQDVERAGSLTNEITEVIENTRITSNVEYKDTSLTVGNGETVVVLTTETGKKLMIDGNSDSKPALDITSGALVSVDSLEVKNSSNGGVVATGNLHVGGSAATDDSAVFTGNTTSGNGGAIENKSFVDISGNDTVEFSGNTAGGKGGAIYSKGTDNDPQTYDNTTVSIRGNGSVSFSNNTATQGGNDIYVEKGAFLNIADNDSVTFTGTDGDAAIVNKGETYLAGATNWDDITQTIEFISCSIDSTAGRVVIGKDINNQDSRTGEGWFGEVTFTDGTNTLAISQAANPATLENVLINASGVYGNENDIAHSLVSNVWTEGTSTDYILQNLTLDTTSRLGYNNATNTITLNNVAVTMGEDVFSDNTFNLSGLFKTEVAFEDYVLFNASDVDYDYDPDAELAVQLSKAVDEADAKLSVLRVGDYEYQFDRVEGNVLFYNNGTVVPEPTTGTLSLLALAGLCARRRRK